MWLAVDKDESVWLFDEKPARLSLMDGVFNTWAVMPEDVCI